MNVKEYLEKYDLTHSQLADLCGLSRQCITHYANGRRYPDRYARMMLVEKTNGEITEADLKDYYEKMRKK
jgi:DNA-binding XRE family transcriptional regulator